MSLVKPNLLSFILFISLVAYGQEPLLIKDNRELFVDRYLIDSLDNIVIKLHHPIDEGAVMYFDEPWEGNFSGYVTVIKDEDLYRVYYRGIRESGNDGNENEVTCIAESTDGITWSKPKLGLFEVNNTYDNNVILANAAPVTHNFSPFLDSNPDTKFRYRALGGTSGSGLIAYGSHDGIHWEKLQNEAVFSKGAFDSQNVAFWSESEEQYNCYFRIWSRGDFTEYVGYRSVGRTTSKDFIHWTEPEEMLFGNAPIEHLYTQQTSPYFRAPHIYVAIGGRFMPGRQVLSEEQAKQLNVNPNYFKDCSDAFFMTSRGKNIYNRTFMEAFIRPGIGLNNWVSRSNYPALNVVQTGPAEMSIYVNQDYAQPTAHLRRYSLRLDGFTSLSGSYEGGEVFTKLFTFEGSELEINFSTSAVGELKFEIQDKYGIPIPGFTMEEADTIIGNEISRIVTWQNNKDLSPIASRPIRLRISIKDADLYSIKFRNNE